MKLINQKMCLLRNDFVRNNVHTAGFIYQLNVAKYKTKKSIKEKHLFVAIISFGGSCSENRSCPKIIPFECQNPFKGEVGIKVSRDILYWITILFNCYETLIIFIL